MKVFKFGGASVATAEKVRNVGALLKRFSNEPLLVVISAMGKTTNALEKVVNAFYTGDKTMALDLFGDIKREHLQLAGELLSMNSAEQTSASIRLNDFFTEAEWLLHDKPVREFDYYYDQVVCTGELISTAIVSHYLNAAGIGNHWVDVRDVLRTDDNFRDARIDWDYTEAKVRESIIPLFQHSNIVLTQGFI